MCWHRWGGWVDGIATLTSPLFKREQEALVQFRRCSKCQKLQTRTI